MKVSKIYGTKKETRTPQFKYPVQVAVLRKWKNSRFQVILTAIDGKEFATDWLWNVGWLNQQNQTKVDQQLEKLEQDQQQVLHRSLQRDLLEVRRKQETERKIERLFN